jgi:hypothetical protein
MVRETFEITIMKRPFFNRSEAGKLLAEHLSVYVNRDDVLWPPRALFGSCRAIASKNQVGQPSESAHTHGSENDTDTTAKIARGKALTKRNRKLAVHAFPERRKTNKFRESHSQR